MNPHDMLLQLDKSPCFQAQVAQNLRNLLKNGLATTFDRHDSDRAFIIKVGEDLSHANSERHGELLLRQGVT